MIQNSNMPKLNYLSPEWAAVEQWAMEQLEEVNKRLSGWNTTDTEIRQLQGRASVYQQMLAFRQYAANPPRQ